MSTQPHNFLLQIIHELSSENDELKDELEHAHAAPENNADNSRCQSCTTCNLCMLHASCEPATANTYQSWGLCFHPLPFCRKFLSKPISPRVTNVLCCIFYAVYGLCER